MQQRTTSDQSNHILTQQEALDGMLAVKINRVIREHYPEGQVDVVEVARALIVLAGAYLRKVEAPGS